MNRRGAPPAHRTAHPGRTGLRLRGPDGPPPRSGFPWSRSPKRTEVIIGTSLEISGSADPVRRAEAHSIAHSGAHQASRSFPETPRQAGPANSRNESWFRAEAVRVKDVLAIEPGAPDLLCRAHRGASAGDGRGRSLEDDRALVPDRIVEPPDRSWPPRGDEPGAIDWSSASNPIGRTWPPLGRSGDQESRRTSAWLRRSAIGHRR